MTRRENKIKQTQISASGDRPLRTCQIRGLVVFLFLFLFRFHSISFSFSPLFLFHFIHIVPYTVCGISSAEYPVVSEYGVRANGHFQSGPGSSTPRLPGVALAALWRGTNRPPAIQQAPSGEPSWALGSLILPLNSSVSSSTASCTTRNSNVISRAGRAKYRLLIQSIGDPSLPSKKQKRSRSK